MSKAAAKLPLFFEFTFPKHRDFPARALQCGAGCVVTFSIAFDLLQPVIAICLWNTRAARAIVSVPETRDNMGHATVDVTQNVYNRTWWEERVEAVSMAAATVWREFLAQPVPATRM